LCTSSPPSGVFVLLRFYTFIRVLRDHSSIFARRRLIYDNGYRARGGREIDSATTIRALYFDYPGTMSAILGGGSILCLAFMTHCAERDIQPESFTFGRCIWWVIFMIAALDFDSMGVQSEFGQIMAMMVVVWGLVLLSMFISVCFALVSVSAYEAWAYSWLNQSDLIYKERNAASVVIANWFRFHKARCMNDVRYGFGNTTKERLMSSEMGFAMNCIKGFKRLKEVQYLLDRSEGKMPGDSVESGVTLSDNLKALKEATIGSGSEESPDGSMVKQNFELRNRVQRMEGQQSAILEKVSQLYLKRNP